MTAAWRRVAVVAVVALAGCQPPGELRLFPTEEDFGAVAVGATSSPRQITVVGAGPGPTAPLVVALAGSEAADFTIVEDTCAGQEVPAAAECRVRLTFTPGALGPRRAGLSFTTGPFTGAAALRGTGADAALLRLAPSEDPHDYGPVLAGGSGQTAVFVVRNDGGVAGPALAVSVSGADASMFVPGTDGCTGQAVAPGRTCSFEVSFRPPLSATGPRSASLQVGGGLAIGLTGNALHVASLSWSPTAHDYGTLPVGQDSQAGDFTFQLSNQGNLDTSAVSLSTSGAADFQLRADTCGGTSGFTLAPGASCSVTVRFVASATGAREGSLVATAGAGAPSGVAATLDGVGQ